MGGQNVGMSSSLHPFFFSTLEPRQQSRFPEGGIIHPGLNSSVPSLPPCHHDTPIAVPRRASNPPPGRSRAASTVDQQSAHRAGRRRGKHPMPQNQSSAHPCPALPRTSLTSIVFNQLKVYQTYPQHNKTTTQEKDTPSHHPNNISEASRSRANHPPQAPGG